ncbi:MAG: AraC family transcriptional regulator [Butyrivibrio sp.]|nr:AraC family transcriptional regulator [Butyrivibrio sp.]
MKEKNLDYYMYIQREELFYHCPYAKEQDFYDLVACGNTEQLLENRKKYPSSDAGKGRLSDDPLRNEIYHTIVNTALIARKCMDSGMPDEIAYTLSDIYINRADKCSCVREVQALNDEMVMDYAARMKESRRAKQLSSAIRRAVNYIYENLNTRLTGSLLARQAGLQRTYFAARFKKETGSTVNDFVTRIRLDTAKNLLISTDYPIIEISGALCFASQSYFCHVFREKFGTTPAKFRQMYAKTDRAQ